jgi:nitroimidazol reductase NimA-like FMN-containing flavoprotein (pyridoxamine 5'-phosphate oxidase superfamily)
MKKRKITYLNKISDIEPIIQNCKTCHIAMVDENNKPYLLPFNFGYDNGIIYLHSDPIGKKIDILKENPNVCINFSTDYELFHINEDVACSYGMRYKSVLVNGVVEFIEDNVSKLEAFNIFMKNYVPNREFNYSDPSINNVCVFKVKIEDFTCKTYGY